MSWKGILGIAASCLVVGLAVGLLIGLRGCGGGGVNKMLAENAELKADVKRFKFLAGESEDRRAVHAERQNTAERAVAAMRAKQAADAGTIKTLEDKVKAAGRKRDERNDLIDAYATKLVEKAAEIDFLGQALDAAKAAAAESLTAEARISDALVASESRAAKLEKYVMKERTKRIMIGVGSAVGASLVTLGAVAAAR
jgi:hypothetical protein